MTLTTTAPLSGGTLTVNGFTITVPNNTLVTLPSITIAWSELFVNGKPDLPLLGSVSWEATVFGNTVHGQKIAGLVYIAQQSTQSLQGFITSIDYNTGQFVVDGATKCVLNDPLGRYGKAYTGHPLWTVDAENPSIHASTGFPVCIPRSSSDPKCPLTNRPRTSKTGPYMTTFTYPAVAANAILAADALDPRIMAPLAVGDYITYSGIRTAEGVLAVYALAANLGIYTTSGSKPAYITAERAQYAIIDNNANLETGETRAVAFGTDISTTIEYFAIDVNPCTGVETERRLGVAQPSSGAAPLGKVIYRLGKTDVSPATREVGFRYSSGIFSTSNELTAGQFIQPVFDFLFPELITFGGNEVPLEFNSIPFLALGSGPLEYGSYLAAPPANRTIVGQLSPWPGAAAPSTTSCPPVSTASSTSATSSVSSPKASSASSTTPSATPTPKDTVTIISATTRNQKGQTITSVTAKSDNTAAKLFLAITGVDNVAATAMTKLANGQFSLDISTKGKPSSVTVTSSVGGKAGATV